MTKTCENPTCNNIAKSKQLNRKVKFCSRKCGLDFHNYLHKLGKRAYAGEWEKRVEWQSIDKVKPPFNEFVFIFYSRRLTEAYIDCPVYSYGYFDKTTNRFHDSNIDENLKEEQPTHWLPIPELKIEAGRGIEAGSGIYFKAGSGIEAGSGIKAGRGKEGK